MINFFDIFKNANRFTRYDINGKKRSKITLVYLIFNLFPVLFGCIVCYLSRDYFEFETKTIGALLSLFTGLLFGLLLKISDKVRQIPSKESVKTENQRNKRIQETNYLKLFFYFLSFSIVVSLGIITLLIIQSFIPSLHNIRLSKFYFSSEINFSSITTLLKVIFIYIYRFLVIYFLTNFILYILLAIQYLYEYIKFDFTKIE